MWGLRTYIKPYLNYCLLAPLFMIFEITCDLLLPKYAAHIVDYGVVKRHFLVIEHTGLIMILITVLSLLTGVLCNVFASRASQNFGADLREVLYTKVQTFSFENMDHFNTGSLITRMTNDVVQVQNLVQIALQGLVRAPGMLIGSVVMALTMSARLGFILLGTLVVLSTILVLLIRFSYPLFSTVQRKLDAVNSRIQENLSGIRVVKAFVRSNYETDRFKQANETYTSVSIRAQRVMALNSPIVTLITNACLVGILFYGANLVWVQSIQVGDLLAFINYLSQILFSLLMISNLLVRISQATVSATRIQEVMATQPKIESAPSVSIKPIVGEHITFQNVGFSYTGSHNDGADVLRNLSFSAKKGEKIAIIGSTGSGKSTIVQLLPRLYDVTTGSIRMDGQDIRNLPLKELRQTIGMVLQDAFLFTGTIRDNIAFGDQHATQDAVVEAAKRAQAHDFISHLPKGYETMIGQKGVNLSGGQKQRIAIARALLRQPSILILDDSTSALDLATEKQLMLALRSVMKESLTLLITQRVTSCLDANQILVIDNGTLVGQGSHTELMKTCAVYQEIYYSQMERRSGSYVEHSS